MLRNNRTVQRFCIQCQDSQASSLLLALVSFDKYTDPRREQNNASNAGHESVTMAHTQKRVAGGRSKVGPFEF
jgi:hypothetical protein